MPRPTRIFVAGALALAACEEDDPTLSQTRDAVVVDAGDAEPLPLTEGMVFTYETTPPGLNRKETQDAEVNGYYRVRIRITNVVDERGAAPSRVSFTMVDETTTDALDWSAAQDFDSWVGRLGPSVRSDDVVVSAPVELVLDGAPSLPEAPSTSGTLPVPSTFFVDIRDELAIATAWTDTHAARNPAVETADEGDVGLVLRYDGIDDRIQFTTPARRSVRLEYTTAGFLRELSEVIGDPAGFPRTSARLELVEGP